MTYSVVYLVFERVVTSFEKPTGIYVLGAFSTHDKASEFLEKRRKHTGRHLSIDAMHIDKEETNEEV